MARDSQGITRGKKMSISNMHQSMTSNRGGMPSVSSKAGKDEADSSTSAGMPGAGEHSMTITDNHDGTYHSETGDGKHMDHPHVGHLAVHVANHHEPGNHLHVMHHGGGATTTHHTTDGNPEPQGPHDAQNIEALKDHMNQFLGEEEQEGMQHSDGEEAAPAMSGEMY